MKVGIRRRLKVVSRLVVRWYYTTGKAIVSNPPTVCTVDGLIFLMWIGFI